jgi:hypothetical protein
LRNSAAPIDDEFLSVDFAVTEAAANAWLNELLAGRAPFGRPYTAHTQWSQLYGWYGTLAMLHYNFGAFDQGLGWIHHIWLGWHPHHQWMMIKDLDHEVIPLYFIAGRGRRIYVADLAPEVRQIEAIMPDGSSVIILSNLSPREQDVQILPVSFDVGAYKLQTTTDTCCDHHEAHPSNINTLHQAIRMDRLPAYSISVLRFEKLSGATNPASLFPSEKPLLTTIR